MIITGGSLAVAAALAVPAWRHLNETPPPAPSSLRLALPVGDDLAIGAGGDQLFGLALAPDGRRLAFPATRQGTAEIWLRDLTTNETTALPGTGGGTLPFWSADGRQLAFFADGRLKSMTLETGQTADLAAAPTPRGGAWHPDGDIIFAPQTDGGLFRRRAGDGSVETWTTASAAAGETSHRFPVILDSGRHVLFFVRAADATRAGVWIAPLDAPGRGVRLAGSDAHAVASADWLLYASQDALLAQQITGLDESAPPALTGRAMLVGTPVGHSPLNQLSATAAGDVVIFGAPEPERRELRWIDRTPGGSSGAGTGIGGEIWDLRIAPRGGGVAVTERDPQLGTLDIFVYEGARTLPRKISRAIDVDDSPVWSPDAARLAWVAGRRTLTLRGAQAELPEVELRTFEAPVRLWDWSADARSLVIGLARADTKHDLFVVPLDRGRAGDPVPFAQTPFNEQQAVVSRDGRWIAYASDESGQPEIYVDSFPTPGHRSRVTRSGGLEPRWGPGAELFFRRGSEIHAVSLTTGGTTREAESSSRLFDAGGDIRGYDVAPDGRRFLLNLRASGVKAPPITVIVNWRSLLAAQDADRRPER